MEVPVHAPWRHWSVCVHATPSLHAVPSAWKPSCGQSRLTPSQLSATSQVSAAGRHVVPASTMVHAAEQHDPEVPFAVPASHCSLPSMLPSPQVGVTSTVTAAAVEVLVPSSTVNENQSLPKKPVSGVYTTVAVSAFEGSEVQTWSVRALIVPLLGGEAIAKVSSQVSASSPLNVIWTAAFSAVMTVWGMATGAFCAWELRGADAMDAAASNAIAMPRQNPRLEICRRILRAGMFCGPT